MKKAREYSDKAIASMILGILSVFLAFVFIGVLTAIIAIILGGYSLKDIKKNDKDGKGMAITGLILGWLVIGIYFLIISIGLFVLI